MTPMTLELRGRLTRSANFSARLAPALPLWGKLESQQPLIVRVLLLEAWPLLEAVT